MDVIGNIFHDIYRILKFLNEDDIPRDTGESQDGDSRSERPWPITLYTYLSWPVYGEMRKIMLRMYTAIVGDVSSVSVLFIVGGGDGDGWMSCTEK